VVSIFTVIEYNNIRIEGDYNKISIQDIKITERLNDHSRLILTGIAPNEYKDTYARDVGRYSKIKLVHVPDSQPSNDVVIFSGLVEQVRIERILDVYNVELICISHTYMLDITVNSKSFQDNSMTFGKTVERVLSKYGDDVLCFYPHSSKHKALQKFVLQFNETDWQFIKRLASMNNVFLLPDSSRDVSAFWIGLPPFDSIQQPIGDVVQSTARDYERTRNILANRLIPNAAEEDFVQIKIYVHDLFFRLGDTVLYKGGNYIVSGKESELSHKESVMKHSYTLSTPKGTAFEFLYNEKLQGNSIPGIVIDTRKDFTKLHLAIDETQDVGQATWFVQPSFHTAGDEKGWCAMPEIGDKLWLHFPVKKEEDCYIISSSGAEFTKIESFATVPEIDPTSGKSSLVPAATSRTMNKNKILEYSGDKLHLNDEGILLTSQESTFIHLTDGGGITISSGNDITFEGENLIVGTIGKYDTEEITIDADLTVELLCGASSIIADGPAGEVHLKAPIIDIASPLNIARDLPADEDVAAMISEIDKLNAFLGNIDELGVDFPEWFRNDLIDCFRNRASDSEIADLVAIAGRVRIEKDFEFYGATRDALIYTSPEGVEFIYPADYSSTANRVSLVKALESFNQLPGVLQGNINDIRFMDNRNPDDSYWETTYGIPGFTSAATGGNGTITFWEPGQVGSGDSVLNYMRHEAGHNLDQSLGDTTWYSETQEWQDFIDADFVVSGKTSPTSYGENHVHEDFAESVTEYLKDPIAFETDFPNRAGYLKEILK
jgi:hypothetical protein